MEASAIIGNVSTSLAGYVLGLAWAGWDSLGNASAPDDEQNVAGGIEAWRRNIWSKCWAQYFETQLGEKPKKETAKMVRPLASVIGSAMFYGIPLTEGEKLRSFNDIRTDVKAKSAGSEEYARVVQAVNTICPMANGVVTVGLTPEDVAKAATKLDNEQIVAFFEHAVVLLGGRAEAYKALDSRTEASEEGEA